MAALEECKEIFHTMDRNHHGEVNVRDLIITLRKSPALSKFLHLSQKVKQEGSARTLQKLFEDIDADHG
jgi:Ca2+-binding EF-hand superfamily protein